MKLPQIQIHELNLLPPRSLAAESKGNWGMNFILRGINKAEPLLFYSSARAGELEL